jgi:hypothetical protein
MGFEAPGDPPAVLQLDESAPSARKDLRHRQMRSLSLKRKLQRAADSP